MKLASAQKGHLAEIAAAEFLQDLGYELCAANYRVPKMGELDLVVKRNDCLTIVEVKARCFAENYGGLPESISSAKLRRMRKAAWCYLKEYHLMNIDVSFLAALVKIDSQGNVEAIDLVPIECF